MELVTKGSSKGQGNTREEWDYYTLGAQVGPCRAGAQMQAEPPGAATHSSEEPSAKLVLGM